MYGGVGVSFCVFEHNCNSQIQTHFCDVANAAFCLHSLSSFLDHCYSPKLWERADLQLNPTHSAVVKTNFCVWPVIQIQCLINRVIHCPCYSLPPGRENCANSFFCLQNRKTTNHNKKHDLLVGGNNVFCWVTWVYRLHVIHNELSRLVCKGLNGMLLVILVFFRVLNVEWETEL